MNTDKFIDLHTHTTFSDGTSTPTELIREAQEKNLSAIAVTDHDTVDGIDEAISAGLLYNVEVISGIELAAYYQKTANSKQTEIHIVGLFLDHKNPQLLDFTADLKAERETRNRMMIERLNSLGLEMTYDELMAEAGKGTCSRAHYANLMVKKGYVTHKKEAFQRYISSGKPGYVPRKLPAPKECIDLIHSCGGLAVLAHATLYGMDINEIRSMVKDLQSEGLDSIEILYSTYRPQQEKELTALAKSRNLLPSGGSDYHGQNKADIFLGIGRGNLRIPYEFLENLKNYRKNRP